MWRRFDGLKISPINALKFYKNIEDQSVKWLAICYTLLAENQYSIT